MLRRFAALAAVFVLFTSVALAEEFRALITKVDGNKVTLHKFKGKEKGDAETITATDAVKVVKGKFNRETKKLEAGDAIEGGLKAKQLSDIGEKGVGASVTV